jgi:uncharacterized membrane protein YfcA
MASVSNSLQRVKWDAIGIGASTLCAIHCLALPFVLAFAPAVAHLLPGDEVVHRSLACFLAAIGLVAFRAGYKVHRKKIVIVFLTAGIAGVSAGAYVGSLLPSHRWEVAVTLVGGGFLILAHSLNRTLCRSCRICAEKTSRTC